MAKSKLKDKPKLTKPQSDNAPPAQSEEKHNSETAEKISAEQPPSNEDKNEVVDNTEKTSDEIQSTEKQNIEAAAISKSDDPDTEPSDKTDEKKDTTDENKDQPVSETIRKMTSSPAHLPSKYDTLTSEKKHPTDSPRSSTIYTKDIMQKDILWASPDDSVQHALTNMQQHDTGYMMVGTDGSLEGILSKSDITGAISPYLRPIFAKWRRPLDEASLQIKIKWIMTRPVHTINPHTPIEQIMENICQFGHRALPVVDQQGKVHGLVTVFDIFQTILKTNSNLSTVGKVNQAPPLT